MQAELLLPRCEVTAPVLPAEPVGTVRQVTQRGILSVHNWGDRFPAAE